MAIDVRYGFLSDVCLRGGLFSELRLISDKRWILIHLEKVNSLVIRVSIEYGLCGNKALRVRVYPESLSESIFWRLFEWANRSGTGQNHRQRMGAHRPYMEPSPECKEVQRPIASNPTSQERRRASEKEATTSGDVGSRYYSWWQWATTRWYTCSHFPSNSSVLYIAESGEILGLLNVYGSLIQTSTGISVSFRVWCFVIHLV